MTSPRRWLAAQTPLPTELVRALQGAPGAPSLPELQGLATRVGSALGVALPAVAPHLVAGATGAGASGVVASATAATKSLLTLGAWVFGGVVLGAGLSSVASFTFAQVDGPAPVAVSSARLAPTATAARTLTPVEAMPAATTPPAELSASPALAPAKSAVLAPSAAPQPPLSESPVTVDAHETELELLRRAQAAAQRNPAQALSLSEQHARVFPAGLLTQEREVIAVNALLQLGRKSEAEARVRAFAAAYPGSAHTQRLRALLEADDR